MFSEVGKPIFFFFWNHIVKTQNNQVKLAKGVLEEKKRKKIFRNEWLVQKNNDMRCIPIERPTLYTNAFHTNQSIKNKKRDETKIKKNKKLGQK